MNQNARKMIREKYAWIRYCREECQQRRILIYTKDGFRKGIRLMNSREGYGRRCNCRLHEKVPREADLACGSWGVVGEMAGKATFIEVGTEKGADLLTRAVEAGAVAIGPAHERGVEIRERIERVMIRHAERWQRHQRDASGVGRRPGEQPLPGVRR
jgi:formate dehydrogenase subunit beta